MKVRKITEADVVKAGDTLYYKTPMGGFRTAVIEKVTRTAIVWSGLKFTKDGYIKGDKFSHVALFIPVAQ